MPVGDALTLIAAVIVVILGARAVFQQTWQNWIKPLVSSVFPALRPEIMSHSRLSAPSEPSVCETDGQIEAPKPVAQPAIRPVSLDTCKLMRAAGLTRDQARAIAKSMDHSLDNNLWAKAAPTQAEDENLIVTPYAGRVTNKKYYPEDPSLEYQELKTSPQSAE